MLIHLNFIQNRVPLCHVNLLQLNFSTILYVCVYVCVCACACVCVCVCVCKPESTEKSLKSHQSILHKEGLGCNCWQIQPNSFHCTQLSDMSLSSVGKVVSTDFLDGMSSEDISSLPLPGSPCQEHPG